jgi:hypothetical protein
MVIWTSHKGAEKIAGRLEISLKDFHYRQKPHISKVSHDIGLNEYRHAFESAATHFPQFRLEYWYGQDDYLSRFPTPTDYLDQHGEQKKKRVEPDGLCSLLFLKAKKRIRFLHEYDNATEPNVRFARDKVLPGIQFLHALPYQQAFNTQVPGVYLVVKKGKKDAEQRYQNMRAEVVAAGGTQFFLFTKADLVTPETVLTGKIWQFPHRDETFSLEEYVTPELQEFLKDSAHHLKLPTLL